MVLEVGPLGGDRVGVEPSWIGLVSLERDPKGLYHSFHRLNQEVGSRQTKPASVFIVDFQPLESGEKHLLSKPPSIWYFKKDLLIYGCAGSSLLLSLVAALFHRLSLVAVREGCSLVAVCGLLIAVVSPVGELGL